MPPLFTRNWSDSDIRRPLWYFRLKGASAVELLLVLLKKLSGSLSCCFALSEFLVYGLLHVKGGQISKSGYLLRRVLLFLFRRHFVCFCLGVEIVWVSEMVSEELKIRVGSGSWRPRSFALRRILIENVVLYLSCPLLEFLLYFSLCEKHGFLVLVLLSFWVGPFLVIQVGRIQLVVQFCWIPENFPIQVALTEFTLHALVCELGRSLSPSFRQQSLHEGSTLLRPRWFSFTAVFAFTERAFVSSHSNTRVDCKCSFCVLVSVAENRLSKQ